MRDAGGVAIGLAGAWREEAVDEGAAGRVTRATDERGARFAVKRFFDASVGARELASLRKLDRRFGPRLLGGGVGGMGGDDGVTWIALEWMEGVSLEARLPDIAIADRVQLAAVVAHGVARALAELHELGVRHGDVKPANIIVHAHVPARDAADDRGATLIDLSLASSLHDDTLAGGTLRYLAPEARVDATRVGPETDLYALGCVLREIVGDAPSEPARWAEALLAPSPGGRPSAAFVADCAARELGLAHDEHDAALARKASVRRAYLRARERDVRTLRTGAAIDDAVTGHPRAWLEEASGAVERAKTRDASSRTDPDSPPAVAQLDSVGRARWLTALFSSPPIEGAAAAMPDGELAEALLAMAERGSVFAYSDLALGPKSGHRSAPPDLVSAALQLAQPRPSVELLAWAEAAAPSSPSSFAVALAEALVRVGEIGRAWMTIDRAGDTPEVLAVRAEIARRRGDVDVASRSAESAIASSSDAGPYASRARAAHARLAWDRGAYDEAERRVEGARGPAAAEMNALIAHARGRHEEGLRLVSLALAEGPPAEARARLEGVRGMLEHARGDGQASMRAFSAAAEHAAGASVVEEATYLTGLGAAAIDVAHVGEGLAAATRAALLWERLGRRGEAARAWLARGSGLALVGADHEARAAADEVLERGTFRADALAVAYAHLVHVETRRPGDVSARVHACAAAAALAGAEHASEARIRVDARALVWAPDLLDEPRVLANDIACETMSAATRFEWWGARVEMLAQGDGPGEPRRVLAALLGLLSSRAPAASRCRGLSAGAVLARKLGDGDAVRRFEDSRRTLASTLREHTPAEFRARLEATPWLANLSAAEDAGAALEPAQIAQLESLVRSLGARDRLAPLLNQVLDALLLWTGVERGLLLLRAPDGGLVARAGRNLARSDLEGDQRELSLGIARRALELGDVVVATDALASLGQLHASVHALRLRSVLAVPLIARGEALGVVYLDDRMRRGAFGPREIAWVRLLSTHAALAVADARDGVRLRRAVRHAERAKSRVLRELEARELELDQVKAALADESAQVRYTGLAGRSEAMRRTLHLVARVSASDVPVLVVGESGTGKELLARAIHETGPRRNRAFVTENCGAVPESLLESILFGHKKGAFTGATATRPGLFEIADGGTLFLDEIGEMSASMQAKLLRVLQDGEIRAVGGDRTRHVDVRILAATHRDLEAMVRAGAFREDLFYRLNVVRIDVPALRDRSEDIPALVSYLVEKHSGGRAVKVTRSAMDRLAAYPWPGNVRQLENEVRRAIVLGGERIDAAELSPEILRGGQARLRSGIDLRSRLDGLEAELVQEALDKTRGNQTKAAELLGVSRFGLQKMIKRLGLRVPV